MKILKVFFITLVCLNVYSHTQCAEAPISEFEQQLAHLRKEYGLTPERYTESLAEHQATVHEAISNADRSRGAKPLGISVGENHDSEGAKCLEMLMLQMAHSVGIRIVLLELSQQRLELAEKEGDKWGEQVIFLQKLIREARRLKMQIIPIDKDIPKSETTQSDPKHAALDSMKEIYLHGKQRESHHRSRMAALEQSFIQFGGSEHLSHIYYDAALNQQFHFLFFKCSFPLPLKKLTTLERIIKMIDDEEVTAIYEQRKRFLDTVAYHKVPVMYNKHESKMYTILLATFGHCDVNINEIREIKDDNPGDLSPQDEDEQDDGDKCQ